VGNQFCLLFAHKERRVEEGNHKGKEGNQKDREAHDVAEKLAARTFREGGGLQAFFAAQAEKELCKAEHKITVAEQPRHGAHIISEEHGEGRGKAIQEKGAALRSLQEL